MAPQKRKSSSNDPPWLPMPPLQRNPPRGPSPPPALSSIQIGGNTSSDTHTHTQSTTTGGTGEAGQDGWEGEDQAAGIEIAGYHVVLLLQTEELYI